MFQASQLTNSILDKVANISETNAAQMAEVVSGVSTTAATMGRVEELLTIQNKILLTIAENTTKKDKGTSPFGFAFKDLGEFGKVAGVGAGVAATMIAMTGAVVASAYLMGMINAGNPVEMLVKFGIALATTGVLYLMATPFTEIIKSLAGISKSTSISGSYAGAEGGMTSSSADVMGMIGAVGSGAIAMIGMAAVVMLSSKILAMIEPDPMLLVKAGIALAISIAMIPMAWAFTEVLKAVAGMQSSMNVGGSYAGVGAEVGQSGSDIKGMFSAVGAAGLAMIGMAAVVVGTAYMMKLIPTDIQLSQIGIAALVALAMIPMAYSFKLIAEAITPIAGNPIKLLAVMGAVAVAFPLILGSMALGLQTWNLLAPSTYAPLPEAIWLLKFGFMALIAAGSFALIAMTAKDGLDLKTVLLAAAVLPLMIGGFALAIGTWGLTMSLFGLDANNLPALPPFMYALNMAAIVAVMAIPAFILSKIGMQGILMGAAGIVAMMGALGLGLSTFNLLGPDDPVAVAANISKAVLQPFYAVIDVIDYFQQKIPIDKAGDLALGLTKVGLGFAAFSAAVTAGGVTSGIGSAVQSAIGVFEAGFDWVASKVRGTEVKEAKKDPLQILKDLANMAPKIEHLGSALFTVSDAFTKIGAIASTSLMGSVTFMSQLERLAINSVGLGATASHMTTIANAFTKIAKASDKINIDGINATKEMFEALDNLAKSGGSDAIDSMKELLVDTLEALADAVHTMTTENKTVSEALGNTITAVTNKLGLTKGKGKEGGAEGPETSPFVESNQQLLVALEQLRSRLDGTLLVDVQNLDNLRG